MSEGCKYILVLIDTATRFCWLQAMAEITAVGVVQEMLHIFSEFRWPSTLVTDGGLNMSKAAVMNILALVGAEARVTIPGAHKQNSAVERTIWEVRQAIKKKCDKHPKEWKSFLPVIQMEINERVSKNKIVTILTNVCEEERSFSRRQQRRPRSTQEKECKHAQDSLPRSSSDSQEKQQESV